MRILDDLWWSLICAAAQVMLSSDFTKQALQSLPWPLGSLPHIGTVSGSVSDTMSQWVYCPMISHGKYGSGFMSAMDTQGASSFWNVANYWPPASEKGTSCQRRSRLEWPTATRWTSQTRWTWWTWRARWQDWHHCPIQTAFWSLQFWLRLLLWAQGAGSCIFGRWRTW